MIVNGDKCRMLGVMEQKLVQSLPHDYIVPKVKHEATFMIGNAVAPKAAAVLLRKLQEHL